MYEDLETVANLKFGKMAESSSRTLEEAFQKDGSLNQSDCPIQWRPADLTWSKALALNIVMPGPCNKRPDE